MSHYTFHFILTRKYSDSPRIEDNINVALTDEEVQLIRSSVTSSSKTPVDEQVRRRLKKIYKKIIAAGYPMCQYYACRDIRLLDMGNDISWAPVDYDALRQEDIECNGFIPHDSEGHPYIKEELLRQWVKWEEQQLSSRSYPDRVHYYEERYHFSVDGLLDNDDTQLRFTLPSEIDISGPTDG